MFQVSNGSQSMIVELFPLQDKSLRLPKRLGSVIFDDTSILPGEVSDDLCRHEPCQHSSICKNTWNDFVCICPRGYQVRQHSHFEFLQKVLTMYNPNLSNRVGIVKTYNSVSCSSVLEILNVIIWMTGLIV